MSTVMQPGTDTRGAAGGAWEGFGVDSRTSPTPAVRGVSPGRRGWTGGGEGQGLASFLAWFSIGLGSAQLLAPRGMARLVGLRPSGTSTTIMRAAGLREIGHGVGILSSPMPKQWMATRVVGDIMDLGLLGATLVKARRKDRALMATLAVLGVTALDVLAFEELSESRKAPTRDTMDELGTHVQRSITVAAPVEEVYRFWHDFEKLPSFMTHLRSVRELGGGRSHWVADGPPGTEAEWDAEIVEDRENERIAWRSVEGSEIYNAGRVSFQAAPGGAGTVVTVEMQYAPPGGKIGAALLKLFRKEPGQQVGDDLRRFKQVMETGEVLLSDATAVPGPHAAQPAAQPTTGREE